MRAIFQALVFALIVVMAPVAVAQTPDPAWLGAKLETVTPALMAERKLAFPFGALVAQTTSGGAADLAGLKNGDIVLSADGRPVTDAPGLLAALGTLAPGRRIDLGRVRAGEAPATVSLLRPLPPKPPEPPVAGAAPQLMLDTGGHTALIAGIAFTPDGKFIVSASDDKTIRVWDWRAGKTVRTIRGEVGPGDEGKLHSMALSPDGKWLAVGGWLTKTVTDGFHIRLYDFASGTLVALLEGHSNVVLSLAFSADSKLLISGQGSSRKATAIIWDVGTRSLLRRLEGHTNSIYAVGFSPDGSRAVTGSYDKTLRLWHVLDGKLIAEMKGHKDVVGTLAIRASDGMIASGSDDGEIRLWNGLTGAFSHVFANQGTKLDALRFSPDGKKLLSGTGGTKNYHAHVFDSATGAELVTYRGHVNIVPQSAISPDGRLAATAGSGSQLGIHVWELSTGIRITDTNGKPLALAGTGVPGWAAGFSKDGRMISWGHTWARHDPANGYGHFEYQLRLPMSGERLGRAEKILSASNSPTPLVEFTGARITVGPLSLIHRNRHEPILDLMRDGKIIASIERGATDGYRHRSYTLTPDGATIVSGGSNGVMHVFDVSAIEGAGHNGMLKAEEIEKFGREFIGHEGDVWAVTPSPDGRLLVSGSGDQTVRLWNLKTRELIATLFHGRDGEWVIWTPQGFYTGSPGGGALVGWQLNKGPDREAEYVAGEQLRKSLNRPEIVERAIVLASAEAAVKEAYPQGFSLANLLRRRPPRLAILSPKSDATVAGGRTTLVLEVERGDLPVETIDITVNQAKVAARPSTVPAGLAPARPGFELTALDVPLAQGPNDIAVVATNAAGTSPLGENKIRLRHTGEGALDVRGTLRIVAVGVDRYPGLGNSCKTADRTSSAPCHLSFAGADARIFAETVKREMGPLHKQTVTRLLINSASGGAGGRDEPTRANIEAAVAELAAAESADTVVVFLAGHGEQGGGEQGGGKPGETRRYYFLPTDIAGRTIAEAGRGRNLIDWEKIQGPVTRALGRRLLFVDACQAGQTQAGRAYNERLLGDARAERFTVFSATSPDQLAEEHPAIGHGYFTYALVEGLKGKALDPRERAVRTYSLGNYLTSEVRAMSSGRQEPEFYSGHGDIVLVRK